MWLVMRIFCIYGSMCKPRWLILAAFVCFLGSFCFVSAQKPERKYATEAQQYLSARGEVILRFKRPENVSLQEISAFLSIDDFRNDTLIAYANEEGFRQFLKLNIPFEVITPPSLSITMSPQVRSEPDTWYGHYPAYPSYVSLMESFATNYPDLCHLIQFGTTPGGKKLLALRITDNPRNMEQEPVVLYSSTMHGDEPLGFVLMLRLMDYLLANYQVLPEVKALLDHLDIWINPLANPDGTYFLSDTSIIGATRFNANNIDLNRNFPDIRMKDWETDQRQPETSSMMAFMEDIRPVLAANFHGGVEVVNYPWDTWSYLHADDEWYQRISRKYADTAQFYGPSGYMTYLDNGITNGNAWYEVYGGRQDYTNFILHGREVTIELSDLKIPPEQQLGDYWNYNKASLLQYLQQALTGFSGVVTDSLTGSPLKAQIRIMHHDFDSSYVVSGKNSGDYYRLIGEGNYFASFSSPGYITKQKTVSVYNNQLSEINVKLTPADDWMIFPNPFTHELFLYINEPGDRLITKFIDPWGRMVNHHEQLITMPGIQEISTGTLRSGLYFLILSYGSKTLHKIVIKRSQ